MKIEIAEGASVKSVSWQNREIEWDDFVTRLRKPHVTHLTLSEYRSVSKEEQKKIKDVGGYVGGHLMKRRRGANAVTSRHLITLDVDFAHKHFWDDFVMLFSFAAVLHSTHSHTPKNPRFRLLIPLKAPIGPDEYLAVSRKIAGMLGIDRFDNTTFEVNRLMFWPAHPSDVEYYIAEQEGEALDAKEILSMYSNWKDTSQWPTAVRLQEQIGRAIQAQADPLSKEGWVGAFCRAYTIHEAIEKFLPEEYTRVDDTRYTFVRGSTAGGLVTYDDKFAYSHHGTDPASAQTCNAFDLVRLHKFGYFDEESQTSGVKLPSFKMMIDLCLKDEETNRKNAVQNIKSAKYDFAEEVEAEEPDGEPEWALEMDRDKTGNFKPTGRNFVKILQNDHRIGNKFRANKFDTLRYVKGSLPWRNTKGANTFSNLDNSGVRNYIETIYSITSMPKIEDALNIVAEQNSYHPVRDYLDGLVWDGEERVDRILTEVFGADDNLYTREAIRKMMVGACARVFEPGIKFDLVLVLCGAQGTGKSTFFRYLAGPFFSDTFTGVTGKEAFEQIQGVWIVEIAELAALRKAEVEAIKHFITKCSDEYRPAYGRVKEKYDRQCVFVGTTNNPEFLRDVTGNRRFMPIDVDISQATMSPFSPEFAKQIDQLWAEALYLYRQGEPLMLSKEAEAIADTERSEHSQVDDRSGVISQWLDHPITEDWADKSVEERRSHFSDPLTAKGKVRREHVALIEIWCECLGKDQSDFGLFQSRQIADMMAGIRGWKPVNKTILFGKYGHQRYYARV